MSQYNLPPDFAAQLQKMLKRIGKLEQQVQSTLPVVTTGQVQIGSMKIRFGKLASFGTAAATSSADVSVPAASLGLTTVLGGFVFAWPQTTWTGWDVFSSGNVASNALVFHLGNGSTAQTYDVEYVAFGT